MKTIRLLTILVTLLSASLGHCAGRLFEEDFLNFSVALIHIGPSWGSGFFLQTSNSTYLVTAKHVLYNLQTTNTTAPLFDQTANITWYPWETNTPISFRLNVATLQTMHQVRFHQTHDIAVVKLTMQPAPDGSIPMWQPPIIEMANSQPHPVMVITQMAQTEKFDDVIPGTDVFLAGYPRSLSLPQFNQFDPDRPLLRKGTIAGKNLKRGTLILDCAVYHGNSGGPVCTKEHPNALSTSYRVIGIATEFVPSFETLEVKQPGYTNSAFYALNSGYSIVEPIDAIFEILWDE